MFWVQQNFEAQEQKDLSDTHTSNQPFIVS